MNVPVKIKKLYKDVKVPFHGSAEAAGYDAFAYVHDVIEIPPQTTKNIGTGLSVEFPEGYFMGVFARSGLACKENLRPSNCVGIIDSDYRGEIIVSIYNDSNVTKYISPNERIAQLVILPFLYWDITITDELNDTLRGSGGFGSTNEKTGD